MHSKFKEKSDDHEWIRNQAELLNTFGVPGLWEGTFDDDPPLPTISPEIHDYFERLLSESKVESVTKHKEYIYYVCSCKGDDVVLTSNSRKLGLLMLVVDKQILFLKISEQDTGQNECILNYTEDWGLTPPSIDSHPLMTIWRNRGNSIPMALDPVRLKFISPVKKQETADAELSHKFHRLISNASWVHKDWITYPDHHLGIVLAMGYFNFSGAKQFPFLYKTEGGCGGKPPFNNIKTAKYAAFHFDRGKSLPAIKGLMKESYLINQMILRPEESIFLRGSHLSQANSKEWQKNMRTYLDMREAGLSTIAILDIIKSIRGTEIPENLRAKAIVLKSEDFILGSIISHLRNLGLIMTELDLSLYLNQEQRIKAVVGNEPFSIILREKEEEKKGIKANPYRFLSEIIGDRESDNLLNEKIDNLELPTENTEFEDLITAYHKMHDLQTEFISSFFYVDEIRIFKTEDVLSELKSSDKREFLRSFIENFQEEEVVEMLEKRPIFEDKEKEFILEWLRGFNSKKYLYEHPTPRGLGSDDSRIYLEIRRYTDFSDKSAVIGIVTEDRSMVDLYSKIYKKRNLKSRQIIDIFQINLHEYKNLCLKSYENRGDIEIYNIYESKYMKIHHTNFKKKLYLQDTLIILYDIPNIERNLSKLTIIKNSRKLFITQISEGYLKKSYIKTHKEFYLRSFKRILQDPSIFIRKKEEQVFSLPDQKVFEPWRRPDKPVRG